MRLACCLRFMLLGLWGRTSVLRPAPSPAFAQPVDCDEHLALDSGRLGGKSDYLRARVLITHFAGDETDNRPEKDDPEADPNPGDERKLIELERRLASIRQNAGVVDIKVFVQRAADGDDRVLRLAGFVEPYLRLKKIDLAAVTKDRDGGVAVFVIIIVAIVHARELGVVVAKANGFAEPEIVRLVEVERRPGEADEDGDTTQVNRPQPSTGGAASATTPSVCTMVLMISPSFCPWSCMALMRARIGSV